MKYLLQVLQFIWLLPMTVLVWMLYVLPLWITGQIKFWGFLPGPIVIFRLNDTYKDNWYIRAWKNWAGWSGPCVMVYKNISQYRNQNTMIHEYRHCQQQFVFGVFHYLLYGLNFIAIKLFSRLDPYWDNMFEIDAREYTVKMNMKNQVPWK